MCCYGVSRCKEQLLRVAIQLQKCFGLLLGSCYMVAKVQMKCVAVELLDCCGWLPGCLVF